MTVEKTADHGKQDEAGQDQLKHKPEHNREHHGRGRKRLSRTQTVTNEPDNPRRITGQNQQTAKEKCLSLQYIAAEPNGKNRNHGCHRHQNRSERYRHVITSQDCVLILPCFPRRFKRNTKKSPPHPLGTAKGISLNCHQAMPRRWASSAWRSR